MAKTVTLENVEILRPGTWNGVPISGRDCEDLVAAFDESGHLLPAVIRLSHDARQAFAKALVASGALGEDAAKQMAASGEGWPALGTVTGLRWTGAKVVATVSNVPAVLASWIKERRYDRRSVGLAFNKTVGGKVYRWWLDHLALLGAETPAVDGLAAIGLSDQDGTARWSAPADGAPAQQGQVVELLFSVTSADGWLDLGEDQAGTQSALDRLVAGLTSTFDEHAPLVYGRKGANMTRQLFQAFLARLRETARAELPMSDNGGDTMDLNLAALRGLCGLGDDAESAALAEALNAADDTTAARLLELAGGMAFETADQLVGWLAGALGLAPSDLAGIAAKVVDLMGGKAPDGATADPNADPAAAGGATPPESQMSEKTPKAPAAPVSPSPQVVELAALVTGLQTELAAIKGELTLRDARAKVRADAQAKGLALAVPVEQALVELAVAGNTAGYNAILANVRGVPAGELGTAGKPDQVELSSAEVRNMVALGYTDAEARRILTDYKQAAAGQA